MMDCLAVIRTRRSIRSFQTEAIDLATLQVIFDSARLAPSAANRQPWRFLLISSREWLDKVHAAYPRAWFMDAPHVAVVVGAHDKAWQRSYDDYNSIETDLAIAMDHLTLAAWALGVGSCWIANFEPDVLARNLGLGVEDRVFAMTPLGRPAADYQPLQAEKDRRPLASSLLVL